MTHTREKECQVRREFEALVDRKHTTLRAYCGADALEMIRVAKQNLKRVQTAIAQKLSNNREQVDWGVRAKLREAIPDIAKMVCERVSSDVERKARRMINSKVDNEMERQTAANARVADQLQSVLVSLVTALVHKEVTTCCGRDQGRGDQFARIYCSHAPKLN